MPAAKQSHAARLLGNIGASGLTESPSDSCVPWSELGLKSAYVIFFTGRCGSTWLSSLLTETGVAGNPMEFLNENVAQRLTNCHASSLDGYFRNLAGHYSNGGRFGIEVDAERLRDIHSLVDTSALLPCNSLVSFFMYRRDAFGQAWSWAKARKTGHWHERTSTTSPPGTNAASEATPTLSDVMQELVRLRSSEEFLLDHIQNHGYDAIPIEYESLVTDPQSTLTSILSAIGVGDDEFDYSRLSEIKGSTRQLRYSDKLKVQREFETTFGGLGRALRTRRLEVSPVELQRMMAAENPEASR